MNQDLRWHPGIIRPLAVFLILSLYACGDTETTSQEENESVRQWTNEDANEWVDAQETIIVPWSHLISEKAVAGATVSEDKILFELDGNDELLDIELNDIIVSASEEHPFLRRVRKIERLGGLLSLETTQAVLTELIYKGRPDSLNLISASGELRQQKLDAPPTAPSQSEYETRKQPLKIGLPGIDMADLINKEEGMDFTVLDSIKINLMPELKLSNELHFDFDIQPGNGRSTPRDYDTFGYREGTYSGTYYFVGTHTCTQNSDCFQGGPSTRDRSTNEPINEVCLDTGPKKLCGVKFLQNTVLDEVEVRDHDGDWLTFDSFKTCNDIIHYLDKVKGNRVVERALNQWLDNPARHSRLVYTQSGIFRLKTTMPYPAHVDWAKEKCSGSLKMLEFNLNIEAEAGLKDFSIETGGEKKGNKEITLFPQDAHGKRLLRTRLKAMVGWLPVWLTIEPSLLLDLAAEVKGTYKMTILKELKYSKTFNVGFHKYSNDYSGQKNYSCSDNGPETGRWCNNESPPLRKPEWKVPTELEFTEVLEAGFDAGVSAALKPRIDTLIYDAAGPYIEPMGLYLGVDGRYSIQDEKCNLGGRVGFKGELGFMGKIPFCSDCGERGFVIADYDTCGGASGGNRSAEYMTSQYCPATFGGQAGQQFACWATCMFGECNQEVESKWLELKMVQRAPARKDEQDKYRLDINDLWIVGDSEPNLPVEILKKDSDDTYDESVLWPPEDGDGNSDGDDKRLLTDLKNSANETLCLEAAPAQADWEKIGISIKEGDTFYIRFQRPISEDDILHIYREFGQGAFCTAGGGTPSIRLGNKESSAWGPEYSFGRNGRGEDQHWANSTKLEIEISESTPNGTGLNLP